MNQPTFVRTWTTRALKKRKMMEGIERKLVGVKLPGFSTPRPRGCRANQW